MVGGYPKYLLAAGLSLSQLQGWEGQNSAKQVILDLKSKWFRFRKRYRSASMGELHKMAWL